MTFLDEVIKACAVAQVQAAQMLDSVGVKTMTVAEASVRMAEVFQRQLGLQNAPEWGALSGRIGHWKPWAPPISREEMDEFDAVMLESAQTPEKE